MIWELLALLVVVCIMILIYRVVKNIFILVLNSVVGFFALYGFNYLLDANVATNVWTALITAIGGIIGFAVVVGCHYLGWAF
ncbi:pro-sigmaK processing inhibitor BofA family protein [Candidatus Woesearchaeota archaeon]|nr:pro-sigmaK processing inhibitor BofA family protein [Candidatus Woesearchaeota archaeon]